MTIKEAISNENLKRLEKSITCFELSHAHMNMVENRAISALHGRKPILLLIIIPVADSTMMTINETNQGSFLVSCITRTYMRRAKNKQIIIHASHTVLRFSKTPLISLIPANIS